MKKICIVTACGNKKHDSPLPAYQIYKSPRIKAVYNKKGIHDMYILSGEHGLLFSERVIEPYNRIMDEDRMKQIVPEMVSTLQKYDVVIFFKGGSRKLYHKCIESACLQAGRPLTSFGYAFLGDINRLPEIIQSESGDMYDAP